MNESRIKVIDSYMGSGKTSYAIQTIQGYDEDTKIIYITPYLDEVERIVKACATKDFVQPDSHRGHGSKLTDLISLVVAGKNIVSTHALFANISDELISALRANNYVLYLDEVFQTVEKLSVTAYGSRYSKDSTTKQDIDVLLDKGFISVLEDYRIKWIGSTLSGYLNIKNLADRDLLYYVNGSLLLWSFPIEVFGDGIFSEIYILTHRFESQLQAYYYQYFGLNYSKYAVALADGKYALITADDSVEKSFRTRIAPLIHVVDNVKLNKIGDSYSDSRGHVYKSALSKTWYESNPAILPIVNDNLRNYFTNITKSKATDRLWTCFKDDTKKLRSKNVSDKYWLAINARATNAYGDRTVLAYLINRYLDSFYDDFFSKKGIIIDQDEFALSELLQWVFRSAVRNSKEVTLYLPSERMRTLLESYVKLKST